LQASANLSRLWENNPLLLQSTIAVTLFAMSITLWMGLYLLARGFPSRMTLRVVVVMLALSGFYYGGYNNFFAQTPGMASARAVLLVIALGGWYGATFHVMSDRDQIRYRFSEWGVYALGALSIIFLAQPGAFINEAGYALYSTRMNINSWAYRVYGSYQLFASLGIMLNLLIGDRVGLTRRGKYFLVASIFPAVSIIFAAFTLQSTTTPRIIQDTLAFCGVFVLGLSVLRHQTWTERRATLEDFPLTTLSALGLAAVTAFFAWRGGMPVGSLSAVVGFVILSIGVYDLTREFLERSRARRESELRKQFRQLDGEASNEETLKARFQEGLDRLCQTLEAPGGFVAIRRGGEFLVMASRSSVAAGSALSTEAVACEDLSRPNSAQLSSLAWIAPSFEGRLQVAAVGIEKARSRMEYSKGNLELLAEVADEIGTVVSLNASGARQNDPGRDSTTGSQSSADQLTSAAAGGMLDSIASNPDEEFIRLVEEALRHLPDAIALGQSALAEKMPIRAESHVERGKRLQEILTNSIEAFKPAEKRPPEPLPRVWYNHAVLYDAYVEGVPNREIMARLYISEGTFNRTRRNAIRGLARMLVEKNVTA